MPGSDRKLNNDSGEQREVVVAITSRTSVEFVGYLRRLGVDLYAKGGKLLLNAPAGTLTIELQEELRRRKPELLVLLLASDDAGEERIAPLTFAQQRLWLIDRFSPGNVAYNIPQSWIVESDVDLDALRRALHRLAERHPTLRTRIETRTGEPFQIVMKQVDIPLAFTDLTIETGSQDQEMRVQALLVEDGRQVFALDRAPLIRFHVLRLAAHRHLISYNLHHIIADQWSLEVLKRDLAALYIEVLSGQAAELPALSVQYADVAERERSETMGRLHVRQIEYWRERLKGMSTLLELPFSKSRPPEQDYAGATLSATLDVDLTLELRQLAARNNTSLYLLMLSIFSVLLYRYTGQTDLCVGTPITGRKLREEEDVLGLFVNMLPLRCTLDPVQTFDQLLKRVNDAVLTDFEFSELPFQKLVMELHPQRSPSHSPLFQIMFALNARGMGADDEQRETFIGVSKFDLTLQIAERSDTMDTYFEYRTDLFAQADIEQFSRHLVRLAQSVVRAPGSEVRHLTLLTQEDLDASRQWNATELSFDTSDTLISLFEQQVRMHPDALALCHEESTHSFLALHDRVSRLAAWLSANGAEPGSFIGVCLDRSPELIVSMLGILKAGAAYLPLDPKYPEERLAYMLKDSGARILIARRNDLSMRLAAGHPDIMVLFAEDNLHAGEYGKSAVDVHLSRPVNPDDAAYLIYTSGSTGRPKGVVVEHRNAVALIAWARSYFDAESLRGVLASTSVCFDLSVFEIFLPLSTGNTIVLIDDLLRLPASPFAEQVTLVNTVPSAMSALLHAGLPSNVRTVCMAGEFLPTELVDRVYAIGVEQVFDLYGPTETTTYSTCTLRLRGAAATIGTPIANTRIYLLDDNGSQVPPGALGEIFIGGAGVTRGYLDRPELTEERFVSIPTLEPRSKLYRTGDLARQRSDGEFVYLGRLDQQIKLRGHRIELGEIEAVLREVSGATQLAVVVQRREAGDTLVAFLEQTEVEPIAVKGWNAELRKRLPAYMIPALIVPLAAMPLTPNGKIDRKALSLLQQSVADEGEGSHSGETPRDLLEQWVANIWAHRLGLRFVARGAHFFEDLGGHSLVAFEIFAEIEDRIGVAMMLATLLQASTVELLAGAIQRHGWKALEHIGFAAAGSAETVIYLVGEAIEAPLDDLRTSGERVMSIGSAGSANGIAEPDAWAREIATLEATQPALMLVGSNAQAEDVRRLAAILLNTGFANVAMRFLELR
jgi:amino acid adenylation domain-containing protein